MVETNVVKSKTGLNYTQINLIPNYYFEPQITEHLAMDYYNLYYNIGGTVGMWVGLSMLSISTAIIYLYSLLKSVYNYISKQLLRFYRSFNNY